MACAHARCPRIVQADCEQWLGELDRSMPTVIVSAKDAHGNDLVDVRLFVDQVPVAEHADGKPVALDPGDHQLRYEAQGYPPIEDRIVASAAEKNRRLSVRFGASAQVEPADVVAPAHPSKPTMGYALAGGAAVALGGFLYFYFSGRSLYSQCQDSGTCTRSDTDSLATKRDATVVLGVAAVLGGIGAYLVLRHRDGSPAMRAGVAPLPDGAAAHVSVEF